MLPKKVLKSFCGRIKMKQIFLGVALAALITGSAYAENVGVTMAAFDDNFLTNLRNGMQGYATTLDGVTLQVEDATNDVGKQQSQIQNFVASGVAAVIVNAVDTDATTAMSSVAAQAGIPLVYVNRLPVNADTLPANQAYAVSDENQAGTLQAQEVCRLLKAVGKTEANAVVMMGELSNQGARQRTKAVHDVFATPECSFIKIADEQTANWQRTQGSDLVSNWLSAGIQFDAVLANNDEMAIGAAQALKAAGVDQKNVIVAGIDATSDALAAIRAGDLAFSVFQNAEGQGKAALDAALKLAKGEKIEQKIIIPFELVTPQNLEKYSK
jgi:inositol transport system substrate-binding protein